MTYVTTYFPLELTPLTCQVEILRNAILYIQSLERCLGITNNPEEAKLVSFYINIRPLKMLYHKTCIKQDKIEDNEEGGINRKEADDDNQVDIFLPGYI